MGTLVLADEVLIPAPPEAVFDLFGNDAGAGWFFGAACDTLAAGSVVRFELPLGVGTGGLVQGTGRIVSVDPPHRIVIDHESPWQGRVTCTVARSGGHSRVRLVAEIPEEAMRWLLRRRAPSSPPKPIPPRSPSGCCSAAPDPAALLSSAARRAGGWDPTEVGRFLRGSAFDGPRGRVSVTPSGDRNKSCTSRRAPPAGSQCELGAIEAVPLRDMS